MLEFRSGSEDRYDIDTLFKNVPLNCVVTPPPPPSPTRVCKQQAQPSSNSARVGALESLAIITHAINPEYHSEPWCYVTGTISRQTNQICNTFVIRTLLASLHANLFVFAINPWQLYYILNLIGCF